jgi:hypothetical protein
MELDPQGKSLEICRQALAWLVEDPDAESVFETVLREREKWKNLPEPQRIEVVIRLLN